MSKTIDFSEFMKKPHTLKENVKNHFDFLQRGGLEIGEYDVVTFGNGYGSSGSLIIRALKALIPAEGNLTIKKVILPETTLSAAGDDLDLGNGVLEIGNLHLGKEHKENTLEPGYRYPTYMLLLFLKLLGLLGLNITIRDITIHGVDYPIPEHVDLAKQCHDLINMLSSVGMAVGKKTWLMLTSGSDQLRTGCLQEGKLTVFDPPRFRWFPVYTPSSFSPPDNTNCHSTFVMQVLPNNENEEYTREEGTPAVCNTELQYLNLKQIHDRGAKGQGVAVAVLSSGCDYDQFAVGKHVVGKWNFVNKYTPVFEKDGIGTCLSCAVVFIAPESKLIACKTANKDDYKVDTPNGVTAKAFKWLREKWSDKDWKEKHGLHSLVVLIPYGGHYREDEMIAINEAIDVGIIVVCAAGDTLTHGPGITFPASMGNVICVGAADKGGRPVLTSPSGREIDCLTRNKLMYKHHILDRTFKTFEGTGISATILVAFVALLLSHIHTLFKNDCYPPEINHVSIIREVLQQTTLHNSQGGYGWIVPDVFRFSKEKIKRLLNAIYITNERKYREPPVSASSKVTEQCQFNTEVLSNRNLNKELDLGVILSGCAIRIAVIDDDFPETMTTTHKGSSLEYIMQGPSSMFEKHVELLKETTRSLRQMACSLASPMKRTVEKQASLLEREADNFTELGSQAASIKEDGVPLTEQHGLQCALIIANILPEVELRLVNSTGADSECESFAKTIVNLVSLDPTERPDIIVSSMGFDQFNSQLAKAVNAAINIGIIPVFSAGNIGHMETNSIAYPGRLGNALCIGAHSSYGQAQEFSSVGREINFLAPGEFMILGRCPVSGTSFSTPVAAAFIALILEYVDKIHNGTIAVSDKKYKSVKVWKNDQWEDLCINMACRNVYVMRELLCQLSLHRTGHAQSTGYGNLDIRRLHDIGPEDIYDIVQNFHRPT